MMDIGASFYAGCEIPFDQFLSMCSDLGMSYVEIQTEHPYTPSEMGQKRVNEVKELANTYDLGIILHGPLFDTNLSSLKERIRSASVKFVQECVELTSQLDANLLVVHAGSLPGDLPNNLMNRARDQLHSSLSELTKVAVDSGVIIGVENKQKSEDRELVLYADEHLEVIEAFRDQGVRAVLDIGHAHTANIELANYTHLLNDLIIELHLHDNNGISDDHLPLGAGSIDFQSFFEAAKSIDFAGPAILELKNRPDLESSVGFLRKNGILCKR
ncbi:MAG: sugar phosphate isomerase/epimerase [Candidatus Thorarchaeota archaeon]|nr:sugar phosphate isomerase/epimerase [Candidatus Thorarchaeota archaeon]